MSKYNPYVIAYQRETGIDDEQFAEAPWKYILWMSAKRQAFAKAAGLKKNSFGEYEKSATYEDDFSAWLENSVSETLQT